MFVVKIIDESDIVVSAFTTSDFIANMRRKSFEYIDIKLGRWVYVVGKILSISVMGNTVEVTVNEQTN